MQTQPKDWTLWISYGLNQAGVPNAFSDRSGNFWYGVLYTGTGYIGAASMSPSGTSSCGGNFSQATPVAMDLNGRCWFGAKNDTTPGSASTGPYLAVYSGATRVSRTLFGTTNAPTATADSNGNIWVTSDNGLYVFSGSTTSPIVSAYTGTGTSGLADGSGNMWSLPNATTLLRSSVSGSTIATQTFTGTSLNPYAMAFDAGGNLWTLNSGNAVAKVTPAAGAYSVSSSYTGGGLNTTSGGSIAIDGDGNVWVANKTSRNLSEFSSSGIPLTPTSGYGAFVFEGIPPQYPILAPIALAADTSGTLWVISNDTNGSLTGNSDNYYLTGFLGVAAPVSPATAPGARP